MRWDNLCVFVSLDKKKIDINKKQCMTSQNGIYSEECFSSIQIFFYKHFHDNHD